MSKKQMNTGLESGLKELVGMKHDTKHLNRYGKSVVPLAGNSEVYQGRTRTGSKTVVIRRKMSHFSTLNSQQEKLKAIRGQGANGVSKVFGDRAPWSIKHAGEGKKRKGRAAQEY